MPRVIIAFVLAFGLCVRLAEAAVLPTAAPGSYAGAVSVGDFTLKIHLRLHNDSTFELVEMAEGAGRKGLSSVTGYWHQIDSGAVIQLTNYAGYKKELSVGSSGSFYLGLQIPKIGYQNITISETSVPQPPFRITGVVDEQLATLQDLATGLVYTVLPSKAQADAALSCKSRMAIEAVVSRAGKSLEIQYVLSSSDKNIPSVQGQDKELFAAAVQNTTFKPSGSPWSFDTDDRVQLTHKGLRGMFRYQGALLQFDLPYTLKGKSIIFAKLDKAEGIQYTSEAQQMALLAGRTLTWSVHGDTLLMTGEKNFMIILEKIRRVDNARAAGD